MSYSPFTMSREEAISRDADFVSAVRARVAAGEPDEWRISQAIDLVSADYLARGSAPLPTTVADLRRELLRTSARQAQRRVEGNLASLRLATFMGDPVQPCAAIEHEEAVEPSLEQAISALEAATPEAATPTRQEELLSPGVKDALQQALGAVQEHAATSADCIANTQLRSLLMGMNPAMRTAGAARRIAPTPFTFVDPSTIPRRQWLYGRHLIRGEISLTLAPGGVGKTSLAVAEAASLVSGRRLLHDQPAKQLRVWLWNGEEPEDELARRFAAVALHYGLKADDFGDRLFIDNGHDMPLVLAEQTRDGVKVMTPIVDELVEALKERAVDIMLVDPFVSTHSVNENDNSAIQRAASAWKEVAQRAGVAIGLAHHVRKLAGKEATAEDSRGGDALVSKVRDARTLNPMSDNDASRLGVAPADRSGLFSTGVGGKSNMAPKGDRRTWFKLVSVGLGNGHGLVEPEDAVAVVTPWTPSSAVTLIEPATVMRLASIMAGKQWRAAPQSQSREDWIGRAVADAFGIEQEEGFQARAKLIIAELVKAKVLVKGQTGGPNRELISIMRIGDLSAYEAALAPA